MTSSFVTISVLDHDYILPREGIAKSKFLQHALSGQYKEQDKIILDEIDPILIPMLEQILIYLMTGQVPLIRNVDDLFTSLALADYLDIAELSDLLTTYRNLDLLTDADLEDIYQDYPYLQDKISRYILYNKTYIQDIPKQVMPLFQSLVINDIQAYKEGPIILLIEELPTSEPKIPFFEYQKQKKIMTHGWQNRCTKPHSPDLIDPKYLPNVIAMGRHIEPIKNPNNPRIYYLACTGDKYPSLNYVAGISPCCAKLRNITTPETTYPNQLGGMKTVMTSTGYIAFIPTFYIGNYIIMDNPTILHNYGWIYDLGY